MKQPYNGNDLIQCFVIFSDFAILNLVLFAFETFEFTEVPQIFHFATKITVFAANASLLLSEMMFSTIIHKRRVSFRKVLGRTFRLSLLTFAIFYVSMRFIFNGGGYF